MENKPLKRHNALQPLSREHHFALLLSWKIRQGLTKEIEIERIGKFLVKMWEHQLSEHFDIEERYVFPILGNKHMLVQEALSDHRLLRRLIVDEPFTITTLNEIEKTLTRHVRLEERQLFPMIQQVATENQLALIEKVHTEPASDPEWEDQFWDR